MIRALLIAATLLTMCVWATAAEAGWRRSYRARHVQAAPTTSRYTSPHDRSALPRAEFRGFGFGGYGYGSGFRSDFRPGRW